MACTRCAQCCTELVQRIKPEKKMVDLLVAHGLINEGEKSLTVKFAHRCQHLDAKNNCMIYEARPQICRDYLCGKARGDAKRPPDLPHF